MFEFLSFSAFFLHVQMWFDLFRSEVKYIISFLYLFTDLPAAWSRRRGLLQQASPAAHGHQSGLILIWLPRRRSTWTNAGLCSGISRWLTLPVSLWHSTFFVGSTGMQGGAALRMGFCLFRAFYFLTVPWFKSFPWLTNLRTGLRWWGEAGLQCGLLPAIHCFLLVIKPFEGRPAVTFHCVTTLRKSQQPSSGLFSLLQTLEAVMEDRLYVHKT